MRMFSQFAFISLLLTLALPASSQTPTLAETIQSIAQMQKLLSQTYKLESAGEGIMNVETIALLAAYGGWTRYQGEAATGGIQPSENYNIVKFIGRIKPDMANANKSAQRNKGATPEELDRFADILTNVENLSTVAMEVHDLLVAGRKDEANAVYRDKSIPLIQSVNADAYTLISSLEKKIDKAALQARLAK